MNSSRNLYSSHDSVLISDETSYIVSSVFLRSGLQVVLRVFGAITNLLNIMVFLKLGLADGIMVAFFSLAVADFHYLFIFLISILLEMAEKYFGLKTYVNLTYVGLVVMYCSLMFLDISVFVTIYISVQKTCCVAVPFIFKIIFTRSRSIYIIACIYIATSVYYLPLIARFSGEFKVIYFPLVNKTRVQFIFTPSVIAMTNVYTTISKTILPMISQAVILICLVVMCAYLKKIITFRRSANMFQNKDGHRKQKDRTDNKEIRVTQAVIVVATAFVIANLPLVLIYSVNLSLPEFSNLGHYRNLFRLCGDISDTLFILSSSVNILVYVKFNTKYRLQFRSLFC
ncbi:unnamed protein product [Candidula unifasciata]|uniref:G-protein coupled receptors family 1 profile domain-containing protein n=1 Tax=Candidula unifasciata TaxID=100452 RepID=A0A8S4A2T2_9EUPU|nr:unnamed protein product [Candidula unifasciata]